MCEKIFSCVQYPLDRLKFPVKTVLDVGANIGVFSMYCADAFAPGIQRIVSVEPFSRNAARIRETAARNGLHGLIEVVNAAAGEQAGTAELLLADSHYSHSILPAKVKRPNAAQQVSIITLDGLKREKCLENIDLLKVDVEGVELEVLRGGAELLRTTRALIIECHKGFCTFGNLKTVLAAHGLKPLQGTEALDEDFGDYCFVREA